MKPHEVKLPMRLGPHGFDIWAEGYRRLGIDVDDVFEIERHTLGSAGLTFTEYIIKGIKGKP